jgi:hypothetical protein
MSDYQLLKKSILHEVRNTKRGKNSLDDEGANAAFCSQIMNKKQREAIGHRVLTPLNVANSVVLIAHFH